MTKLSSQAAAAVASLPITYEAGLQALVLSVSGEVGWARRAAAALRTQPESIVVVERPVRSSSDELVGREDRVVVDSAWGHNPTVADATTFLRASTDPLVELHVDAPKGDDLRQWVFEALLLLDRLVGVAGLEILDETVDRFVATGTTPDGRALSVTAARIDALEGSAHIRSIGSSQRITVDFFDPDTARPPLLSVETTDQLVVVPTAWETGSRGAWRQAASIATSPVRASHLDLFSFRNLMQHFPLH